MAAPALASRSIHAYCTSPLLYPASRPSSSRLLLTAPVCGVCVCVCAVEGGTAVLSVQWATPELYLACYAGTDLYEASGRGRCSLLPPLLPLPLLYTRGAMHRAVNPARLACLDADGPKRLSAAAWQRALQTALEGKPTQAVAWAAPRLHLR